MREDNIINGKKVRDLLTPDKKGRLSETLIDDKNAAFGGAAVAASGLATGNILLAIAGAEYPVVTWMAKDNSQGNLSLVPEEGLESYLQSNRHYGGDSENAAELGSRDLGIDRVDG
jgi:hypothetical protein